MKKGSCHHCGRTIEVVEKVFRKDTCPACGSDLYCCLNCVDYDSSAPRQCRESQADGVSVKDRRNYCDYFVIREGHQGTAEKDRADAARRKLEELFRR
jgi:hypothetical protein